MPLSEVGRHVLRTELFGGGKNEETAYELFYEAQVTPRMIVQPDVQFILSPSGIYRNALAVGLRFRVDF